MKGKVDHALIFNLKGQISKILSTKATILREEEKCGLEGTCNAIDTFALSEKELADQQYLYDDLKLNLSFLRKTRKEAIKKRILPTIEKVLEDIDNE